MKVFMAFIQIGGPACVFTRAGFFVFLKNIVAQGSAYPMGRLLQYMILAILSAVYLTACSTVAQRENQVMIKYAKPGSLTPTSILADSRSLLRGYVKPPGVPLELYRDVPEMATLAGYVYRGSTEIKSCPASPPLTFSSVPALRVDIPDRLIRPREGENEEAASLPLYAQKALGLNKPYSVLSESPDLLASGLTYEVWQRDAEDNIRDYAVVFRGTNLRSKGDWCANLRPFGLCRDQASQFDQVRALTPALLREIKSRAKADGKTANVIAVGHSLGGALAQKAAYTSDDIDLVFAFNASPVLGYLDDDEVTGNLTGRNGLTIFRIFEAGEILAPVRAVINSIKPLSSEDPQIVIMRYSLHSGLYPFVGLIENHNMVELACGLREVEQEVLSLEQSGR